MRQTKWQSNHFFNSCFCLYVKPTIVRQYDHYFHPSLWSSTQCLKVENDLESFSLIAFSENFWDVFSMIKIEPFRLWLFILVIFWMTQCLWVENDLKSFSLVAYSENFWDIFSMIKIESFGLWLFILVIFWMTQYL